MHLRARLVRPVCPGLLELGGRGLGKVQDAACRLLRQGDDKLVSVANFALGALSEGAVDAVERDAQEVYFADRGRPERCECDLVLHAHAPAGLDGSDLALAHAGEAMDGLGDGGRAASLVSALALLPWGAESPPVPWLNDQPIRIR